MKPERESNIELLRLIAMFFIVIFHFIFHNAFYKFDSIPPDPKYIGSILLTPFLFVSVNCYILISGYFMIQSNLKRIFLFYSQCVFYAVIIYFIVYFCIEDYFSYRLFLSKFLPLSYQNDLWFIPSYFSLLLLSPLLNLAIKYLNKKEYKLLLIAMTFLVVYLGYFHDRTDLWIYNLLFMYLYLIGGFIKLYFNLKSSFIKVRYLTLIAYFVFSLLQSFFLLRMFFYKTGVPEYTLLRYDNPLVILSSISLFLFFLTFSFKNKVINWMAASSFTIYLIHENRDSRPYLEKIVSKMYTEIDSVFVLLGGFLVLAVFVCIACILIDKVRIVLVKPIEKYACVLLDKIDKKY